MPLPRQQRNFDNLNTPLNPVQEHHFQTWKQQYAPQDSGFDYDLRGAYLGGVTPDENGHWPDTHKKPNHPTFSAESKYAPLFMGHAGSWQGENFQPAQEQTMPNSMQEYYLQQRQSRRFGPATRQQPQVQDAAPPAPQAQAPHPSQAWQNVMQADDRYRHNSQGMLNSLGHLISPPQRQLQNTAQSQQAPQGQASVPPSSIPVQQNGMVQSVPVPDYAAPSVAPFGYGQADQPHQYNSGGYAQQPQFGTHSGIGASTGERQLGGTAPRAGLMHLAELSRQGLLTPPGPGQQMSMTQRPQLPPGMPLPVQANSPGFQGMFSNTPTTQKDGKLFVDPGNIHSDQKFYLDTSGVPQIQGDPREQKLLIVQAGKDGQFRLMPPAKWTDPKMQYDEQKAITNRKAYNKKAAERDVAKRESVMQRLISQHEAEQAMGGKMNQGQFLENTKSRQQLAQQTGGGYKTNPIEQGFANAPAEQKATPEYRKTLVDTLDQRATTAMTNNGGLQNFGADQTAAWMRAFLNDGGDIDMVRQAYARTYPDNTIGAGHKTQEELHKFYEGALRHMGEDPVRSMGLNEYLFSGRGTHSDLFGAQKPQVPVPKAGVSIRQSPGGHGDRSIPLPQSNQLPAASEYSQRASVLPNLGSPEEIEKRRRAFRG